MHLEMHVQLCLTIHDTILSVVSQREIGDGNRGKVLPPPGYRKKPKGVLSTSISRTERE